MAENAIVRAVDVDIEMIQRTAKLLAVSRYFEVNADATVALAQMATKILAGREMGYGPFASVQGIHIIQGRPSISANLMAAAVKGHPGYDYRVRKMDATLCELEFFEVANGKRESLGISSFTAAEAKAAGTKNMDRFPRNMLFARAMSNGVRWYCPDVFSGNTVYVPEELDAEVDGNGDYVDSEARHVNQDTGEITTSPSVTEVAPPAVNGDAGQPSIATAEPPDSQFEDAPPPPPAKTNGNGHKDSTPHGRFYGQGQQTFGPDWDKAREQIALGLTFGKSGSSKDLPDDTKEVLAESFRGKRKAWQNWWKACAADAPVEMPDAEQLMAQPA